MSQGRPNWIEEDADEWALVCGRKKGVLVVRVWGFWGIIESDGRGNRLVAGFWSLVAGRSLLQKGLLKWCAMAEAEGMYWCNGPVRACKDPGQPWGLSHSPSEIGRTLK